MPFDLMQRVQQRQQWHVAGGGGRGGHQRWGRRGAEQPADSGRAPGDPKKVQFPRRGRVAVVVDDGLAVTENENDAQNNARNART